MFQGNWTCSKCGGAITQLPFEPRSNAGLTCRDCYFNNKNGGTGGVATPADNDATAGGAFIGGGDVDDREAPPFDPEAFAAGEPTPEDPTFANAAPAAERKMFEGEWSCSMCGNAITKLPFEPRNTDGLKCMDCFRKG